MMPFVAACEKELDFKYHDIDPIPVIEGSVTQEGAKVSLTNTTPMDVPMDTVRFTDASIILHDLTDGNSRNLMPDASGYFRSDIPGIPGHEYRLEVQRNGKEYYSECKMRGAVEILETRFQWIDMTYDDVAVFKVMFKGSDDSKEYYWVRLYRNGEPYMWSVVGRPAPEDGIYSTVFMTSRKDADQEDDKKVLKDGDVVSVSVTPISLEMADYLAALSANSSGPRMFQGDFCLGYFVASEISSKTIVYHPDEF